MLFCFREQQFIVSIQLKFKMESANDFKIKVDVLRNVPYVIDAFILIGLGVVLLINKSTDLTHLLLDSGFVLYGIVQLIRKIKTFHLTDTELIIKRPLFPFAMADEKFEVSKIKEIKFVNIKFGGGSHLRIETIDEYKSFRIETAKENIDEFEIRLKSLGIVPIRDNM